MNGQEEHAGRAGAWVIALCWLAACNAGPESRVAPAATGPAAPSQVTAAVRAATDRSALRQDVVTLPSGERMRRITSESGFNHVLVGRVDADGRRSISCVDSAPAAESFLAGGAQGGAQ